ncbi:MAG: MOSC domain-containing protein [Bacteroidota bacterium]
MATSSLKKLFDTLPQIGQLKSIAIRPVKRGPLEAVAQVSISVDDGLLGDHYQGKSRKRQVTLIQAEHLDAVGNMLGGIDIDPLLTRRNLVVSGINLLALKGKQFRIGEEVILETTGPCEPCSRMETNFGPGGYNAMRGHGGICAKVIRGGVIRIGNDVKLS